MSGISGYGAGGMVSPLRQHYKVAMGAQSQVGTHSDMSLDVART